jgi:hypothetical protein
MPLLSSNGWPASSDPNEIGVKSYPVKGTKIKLRCASKCAPLLVGFATEFHALIEPIDEGTLDDWGYAFRNIRGSRDRLSNHASATAIDINAKLHQLGKVGTFPSEKVPMIRALAKKYGLRWGGDYTSRADEMHFEINLSEAKVAALIGSLKLGDKDE